jgi:GTP cyclohydrolase I
MIGQRQQKIAFEQLAETLEERPDRETLENTRRRLETEAYDALASLGFKAYEGLG